MRLLIAPDKFRGTLTASQAARAIETGWLRARPHDFVDLLPLADGGEGTLDALTDALGGETVTERVTGPLGDPVDAAYGIAGQEPGGLAIVESARASGIALVSEPRWNPLRSTTRGTGELIRAALGRAPARVIVCIGGSATNDGGAGMAQALGARLLDASGEPIQPGGAGLLELARIDVSGIERSLVRVSVIVASDVDNPLTGPRGASQVYGPQKGDSGDDVRLLDGALGHLAAIVHRDLAIDLRDAPGAGAAGGLGFGLMAFCGAKLRPGVEVVMEAVGFPDRLERADLVITGEGKLDEQSLHGKVPAGVIRVAWESGVPVAVVCGRADVELPGIVTSSLVERFGEEQAMGETRPALERLAEELAARTDLVAPT
ncbi:MAG TPA: glycerate kinase [Actinomycetota bacterium]|jgi:glycerate kinase|nr:glycerate kinase [Actinomycetota bacterium]